MAPLFRGRGAGKVPALVPIPPIAELPPAKMQASARYLGTLDADGARVVGQSLSARSAARLSLSAEALDVVRIAGSFRIRLDALRGARTGDRFAGKPVTDLLLVRWAHAGQEWETGFRLDPSKSVRDAAKAPIAAGRTGAAAAARPDPAAWVRTLSKLARQHASSDATPDATSDADSRENA